jgi:hypothetical protein
LLKASEITWVYLKRAALWQSHRDGQFTTDWYQAAMAELIQSLQDQGVDPRTHQGDLEFRGEPFERIQLEVLVALRHRLEGRLRSLGWLLGYKRDWDEPLFDLTHQIRPTWLADFRDGCPGQP